MSASGVRVLRWLQCPGAAILLATVASATTLGQTAVTLPNNVDSLKFAVIGDLGTGLRPQNMVARQMEVIRATFPFNLVVTVGDNIYGPEPPDYVKRFELPYAVLLAAGVKFQAALGNHDRLESVSYEPFNMNGHPYYTFTRNDVRFFVLDSTRMEAVQLTWLERSLKSAREEWKIVVLHHPLYSDGIRNGPVLELRDALEPLFGTYGVDVVFSGHDHVYERITPQQGIVYFITGSAGALRVGGVNPSAQTAAHFDADRSFMLVEVAGTQFHFQAVSRTGKVVDSGVIQRR